MIQINLYEAVGLLTHLIVFAIGLGAMIGVVPLERGGRAGLGLILMALAMTVLILAARFEFGLAGALTYVAGLAIAFWLLLGLSRSGKSAKKM